MTSPKVPVPVPPLLREILGTHKARLQFGKHSVLCSSPTLETLGDFETKFGAARMVTSGDETLRPTTIEFTHMMWGICKDNNPPWKDLKEMMSELKSTDLMGHVADIAVLFFGASALESTGTPSS